MSKKFCWCHFFHFLSPYCMRVMGCHTCRRTLFQMPSHPLTRDTGKPVCRKHGSNHLEWRASKHLRNTAATKAVRRQNGCTDNVSLCASASTMPLHTQLYPFRGGFNSKSVLLTVAKLALDNK